MQNPTIIYVVTAGAPFEQGIPVAAFLDEADANSVSLRIVLQKNSEFSHSEVVPLEIEAPPEFLREKDSP